MKRVISVSIVFFLSAGWAAADRHAYPRTVLEDRPIGYWRFEETRTRAGVENLGSQETALDGTCIDVTLTPESATAALGQAAVFDQPTSRIELQSKVSPWLNKTASLEFWIKTKQRGEGSWNAPAIFGADSNGDGNGLFWGTNSGGRVGVRRGDSGPVALTPAPLDDNCWHHVVLTRDHDSGLMKAYLDRRLVDTYHDAGRLPIKTTYGTIGQVESLPGQGQKFLGTLDEVAVYDYVLSPRQVKQHWEAAWRRTPRSPLGSQTAPASQSPPREDWIALAPLVELKRDPLEIERPRNRRQRRSAFFWDQRPRAGSATAGNPPPTCCRPSITSRFKTRWPLERGNGTSIRCRQLVQFATGEMGLRDSFRTRVARRRSEPRQVW